VQDDGEPVAQVPPDGGGVEPERLRDDHHQPLVTHLVAVAEGAVDDSPAPLLGQALDLGELVGDAGGGDDPTGHQRVAAAQVEPERAVLEAAGTEHPAGQHLAAVGADLLAADGHQLGRRGALAPEVAVHVLGGRVARGHVVDDDHAASLPRELQSRCQARGRAADDCDLAVALHRASVPVAVPVLVLVLVLVVALVRVLVVMGAGGAGSAHASTVGDRPVPAKGLAGIARHVMLVP
jgi:hypothetical protein